MANKNIPQESPECKGISEIITELEKQTNRTGYIMGASALKRGNQMAVDVFRKYGGDIFVDDSPECNVWESAPQYRETKVSLSGFTTPVALASFLGISTEYLRGIMGRYRFTSKHTPHDVHNINIWQSFGNHDSNRTIYRIAYGDGDSSGTKVITNTKRKQTIRVRNASTTCQFISGRVALCLCFIMVYGQKIPKGSMSLKILKELKCNSVYGNDARATLIKLGILEDDGAGKQPVSSPATGISADELIKILKAFSGEIAAAVGREIVQALGSSRKPTNQKKSGRRTNKEIISADIVNMYKTGMSVGKIAKTIGVSWVTVRSRLIENGIDVQLVKPSGNAWSVEPDNWHELVSAYDRGELSQTQIAAMLGWGRDTVRRHIVRTHNSVNGSVSERRSA